MIGNPVYRPTLQDAYDEAPSAPQITGALNVSGSVEWDALKYLDATTGGANNIHIGENVSTGATGVDNVIIGQDNAGLSLTTGNKLVMIGSGAGEFITTAESNTGIGYFALNKNVSGFGNMALGSSTLSTTTTGQNTAIGHAVLTSQTTGNSNTAIGYTTMLSNLTGQRNLALGTIALRSNSSGSNNVAMGYGAGFSCTGSSNVFIGYDAGYNETGSNKLYIDSSNTANPLVYGDFSADEIKINGSFEFTKSLRTSAVETVTASSDTLDDTNFAVLCDASSNNITINLPAVSGNTGLTYVIKKTDSSSNTVTIDGNGSETIDGSTTEVLSAQHEVVRIMCDGTEWWII